MKRDEKNRRRGSVLFVCMALLGLLLVFALAFASLVNVERTAAGNYVSGVRARLTARAGLEYAFAELRRLAGRRHYSAPRADFWEYRLTAPPDLAGRQLDLGTTLEPSFAEADVEGLRQYGAGLVASGVVGRSQGARSRDAYRLRIQDAASQLDMNHPDALSLQRMLASLLRATNLLSVGPAAALARRVVSARPAGGFRTKAALKQAFVAEGILPSDWRRTLRCLVTVHAWVDVSVIRPWRLNGIERRNLTSLPRAPINLNTAPAPVLTALLAGLRSANDYGEFSLPYAGAQRLARKIVERREGPAGPFKGWVEFEGWIDGLPNADVAGLTELTRASLVPAEGPIRDALDFSAQGVRDTIKAMLNPNSMISKLGLGPNHGGSHPQGALIPRLVDKADLIDATTEGCFDAMGVYEIESLGQILLQPSGQVGADAEVEVLAEARLEVVARVYDVLRLTTQEDLERNRALMVRGDFIRAGDKDWIYTPLGVNEPAYRGFEGWPGIVSYPEYSLRREGRSSWFAPADDTAPATWGGYLTLTNLVALITHDQDFVAGFARASLKAFKVRAWWEPVDQRDDGSHESPVPSRPSDAEAPMAGGDLTRLATPRGRLPLTRGVGGRRSVLDRGSGAPSELFREASALWNTGVCLSPLRTGPGGAPRFLTYDSDNLDLLRGTSIRFWVQPLVDPFLRDTEVLFSFVGSRDGQARQVGFRLKKEVTLGQVKLVLEGVANPPGPRNGWQWVGVDEQPLFKVEMDVSPGNAQGNPEWLPNTWHWVVIDFGPAVDGVYTSLRVDKKLLSTRLPWRGTEPVPSEWGEYHGHVHFHGPSGPPTSIRTDPPLGPPYDHFFVFWMRPRLLGDYYFCDPLREFVAGKKEKVYAGAVAYDPQTAPNGGYVPTASWPAQLFPQESVAREVWLRFMSADASATASPPPDVQMTQALDGSWRHDLTGPETGLDGVAGGRHEWRIDLVTRWVEESTSGPQCASCDHCLHEDRKTRKNGRPYEREPADGVHCWNHLSVIKWGRIPGVGGQQTPAPAVGITITRLPSTFPVPLPVTTDWFCDQCFGCEDCDVDGPLFFGGEPPEGSPNYVDGRVSDVDPHTSAWAVFDNIQFVNNKERRTDAPGSMDFEDRFWETSLADVANLTGQKGFGAVYHRGLQELLGSDARLGTLSWTSYPTSDGALDLEASLWRVFASAWRKDNDALVAGPPLRAPSSADAIRADPTDPASKLLAYGLSDIFYRGRGEDPDLLVLGLQLAGLDGERGVGIPQPILQSPVLEDVTLTVLRPVAVLEADEGDSP